MKRMNWITMRSSACMLLLVLLYRLAVSLPSTSPQEYKKDGTRLNGTLPFLVIGDWGGQTHLPYTTEDELACAKQMGMIAERISSSFVLALGDNFYEEGIPTDAYDKRFQETFEDVFTHPSLQTPWYVIAGNHDWRGNITAELEYTKLSKRWNFPSLYYKLEYTLEGTNSTVVFIMIDTVVLCGVRDKWSTPEELEGPADKKASDVQWQWIETQLKDSASADYVIVAGHYPVWSIAEHGPTASLVSRLRPMLIKYNVSAYFSGHDHNLQHLREDSSTVDYFVIGAGHIVDGSQQHRNKVPPNSLKYCFRDVNSKGGFAYIVATPVSMQLIFADGLRGQDLYMAEIKPRTRSHSKGKYGRKAFNNTGGGD